MPGLHLVGWRWRAEWKNSTWYQYKDCLSRYRGSHYKDKMVIRPSYLYNWNSCSSLRTSFLLIFIMCMKYICAYDMIWYDIVTFLLELGVVTVCYGDCGYNITQIKWSLFLVLDIVFFYKSYCRNQIVWEIVFYHSNYIIKIVFRNFVCYTCYTSYIIEISEYWFLMLAVSHIKFGFQVTNGLHYDNPRWSRVIEKNDIVLQCPW